MSGVCCYVGLLTVRRRGPAVMPSVKQTEVVS
jgi:hypothetical protein